jgi:hypothetical protein
MRKVAFLCALAASSLFAQTDLFHKAPPAVEEALRARISKFYQSHVDGKFRLAEPLVAEECKDFFYSANKPKYFGFEIKEITYTHNFTKAKAVVLARMIVMAPGFLDKPVPVPIPSRWKLVDGEWYWYITDEQLNASPFGQMKGGSGTVPAVGSMPAIPSREEAAKLLTGVRAEKEEIELKSKESSTGQFTIVNKMPGHVTLALDPVSVPGFSAQLDSTDLAADGKAHVTVEWKPGAPAPKDIALLVRVQPTNQLIHLKARFND